VAGSSSSKGKSSTLSQARASRSSSVPDFWWFAEKWIERKRGRTTWIRAVTGWTVLKMDGRHLNRMRAVQSNLGADPGFPRRVVPIKASSDLCGIQTTVSHLSVFAGRRVVVAPMGRWGRCFHGGSGAHGDRIAQSMGRERWESCAARVGRCAGM